MISQKQKKEKKRDTAKREQDSYMRMAREEGIPVGMIRLQTLWPFPTQRIREFAKNVSHIVVPELNLGQMAHEIEHAAQGNCKVVKVNKITGEPLPPLEILETIKECK